MQMKASTAPPLATIQRSIRIDYHRFMHEGLSDWPTGGPSKWLGKWEALISRAERYNVPLLDWLTDVSTVWRPVPALTGYFDTVERRVIEQKERKYTTASVSAAIQQNWEHIVQGRVVRRAKPKTTRSGFTAEEVTLNGEEADTPSEATTTKTTAKRGKKRRRNETDSQNPSAGNPPKRTSNGEEQSSSATPDRPSRPNKKEGKRGDRSPSSACGGKSHYFTRCYLVLGLERD